MSDITPKVVDYFANPAMSTHRQYEALRSFFYEKTPAKLIAEKYGYTINALYSLFKEFKERIIKNGRENMFFQINKPGRKQRAQADKISELIILLRKQYLSIPEIKAVLDVQKHNVAQGYIWSVLKKEKFARLPRRDNIIREQNQASAREKIKAPESEELTLMPETFNSQNIGILCLLPYMKKYGIDTVIEQSMYPGTKIIDKLSSILSFAALKLSNIRRYSADDMWCMDRGPGLFAKLNVLPKAAWFSSYSDRVIQNMNTDFLKKLHRLWKKAGLLSDTMNLDFTSIPYWGDDNHLENNWSGKRHSSLASMLAVLAQDPDSGIIDYGDTTVRHQNQSKTVHEFLDFYRDGDRKDKTLRYLVFDSKFTTTENLRKLEDNNIKFVTIRRRGKNIVQELENLPPDSWKSAHVMNADGKGRTLRVSEQRETKINGYGNKYIRQVAITGHGKIKPALIISNDFDISLEALIRKYSRRWIIEKQISEQIEFFHLNHVSSSMVIKVDFDFVMTILAHNIYRLFALNLPGYSHHAAQTIFEKFLSNSGQVNITFDTIEVNLKKKRNLPLLLSELDQFQNTSIPWLDNRKIIFSASSTT